MHSNTAFRWAVKVDVGSKHRHLLSLSFSCLLVSLGSNQFMSSSSSTTQLTLYALLISLPLVVLGRIFLFTPLQPGRSTSQAAGGTKTDAKDDAPQTIMQPARDDLEPPKDTPYTQAELAQFDGSDSTKPIYVAIKGA
jgi:hypothetical protein